MPKKFFDIIPPEKARVGPEKKEEIIRPKKCPFFAKSLIFCLAVLILLGIAGSFFFSKVEIEIWPKTDILFLEEKVILDFNAKQVDFEGKVIPAKIFSNQKFAFRNFPATGKILKKEKAKGLITVYNAYSTSSRVLIPSRFVSADGKLFWSTKKIVIPGARYEKGKLIPGETEVEVVAAEPGKDYNIGPSTFALPALSGTKLYTTIYGKSFSPMEGGFIGEVPQISEEDLKKAENILTEDLKKESREFLKTALPAGFVLVEETLSQEVIESNSSLEPGAEAETFNFQVKVKSEALGFKESDLKNFVKYCIDLNIEEGKKFQEESLEINYSFEQAGLDLKIKAKIFADIDLAELKKALLGKSLKEARLFLENLAEINRVEIRSWPFLKKKIPDNPDKVELRLNLD